MTYDNPLHERSRVLAAKEVRLRMTDLRTAASPPSFEGAKQLIYSSLERIGTLLPPDKQPKFYGIAIDFLPRGSFSTYACFPEQQPPYVLIDTGMFDFFGNLSALFTLLADCPQGAVPIPEQRIIDYIWASGLIYYANTDDPERHECGIPEVERAGAAIAPKLQFGQLPARLRVLALNLSMGATLFFICHEIAHILNRGLPSLSETLDLASCRNLESQAVEAMADDLAFRLMIDYAIRFPDAAKVKSLLSSVHFALTTIALMQSAFPNFGGTTPGGEDFVIVRESLDHPPAVARASCLSQHVQQSNPFEFLQARRSVRRN